MPQNLSDAEYTYYAMVRTRWFRSGLSVQPVAGPPGALASVVRLDSGSMDVAIQWSCARIGAPPDLPHHESADPNYVLIEGGQSGSYGQPVAGGLYLYGATGVYRYSLRKPEDLSKRFSLGRLPLDSLNPAQYHFHEQGRFLQSLTDWTTQYSIPDDLPRALIQNLFG